MIKERSIEIPATPQKIWPFFVDPEQVMKWFTFIQKFEYTGDKQSGVGTTFYCEEKFRLRTIKLKFKVEEWVENEKLAFSMTSGSLKKDTEVWSIKAIPTGSLVTLSMDKESPWGIIGKVMDKLFVGQTILKHQDEILANLKTLVGVENNEDLTAEEREQLEKEYVRLCEDWRWRDKYVLDKLTGAGILFTLFNVAIGTIQQQYSPLRPFFYFSGALFSSIIGISVAKDMLFRDGTESAIIRIAKLLHIDNTFRKLKDLQPEIDGIDFEKTKSSRKIRTSLDKSYLGKMPIIGKWLYKRSTFKWILTFFLFYSLSFFVFLF